MSAKITQLIDKFDNSEVIRDEVAAILVVESANQQALATAAGKDPNLWKLQVFLERSNPWSEWIDAPEQADATPIVNVSLNNANTETTGSNVVERQKVTGIFNIDCYGYGVSASDGATGHAPGDESASLEAQRAVRLVRNVLMAGAYTYLGLRGIVWGRWVQSVTVFQPAIDGRNVSHVVGARMAFQVVFNELSPQVQGETLELISATVKRKETGQVYLTASYEPA